MTAVDATCETISKHTALRDHRSVVGKGKHDTKASNDDHSNFGSWPGTGENRERATRPVEQEVLQRGRAYFVCLT